MDVFAPHSRQLGRAMMRSVLVFAVLSIASPAVSQGLMVRPTKFEVAVHPGKSNEIPFTVTNMWSNPSDVEILGVVLLQAPNGNYQFATPDKVPAGITPPRSCLSWVSVAPTTGRLQPLGEMKVVAKVDVPRDARGSYACALLVRNKPTEGPGMRLIVQIVCPLIATVIGPPAQQRLEPKDVDLTFEPSAPNREATTTTGITIINVGESYERISGCVTVLRQAANKWREVTRQDLRERGLLAGSAIRLDADLKRRFPPGKYKLLGQLRVGGKVRATIEKEIDFVGDPTAPPVVDDVTLTVDPPELVLDVVPGGRLSRLINVTNPSEEEIDLTMRVVMPPALEGVAMGTLTGPQLSAAQWTTVSPESATLRAGGQRSVRLVVEVPKDAPLHPSHYAIVQVDAKFADGHVVSRPAVLVFVRNPKKKPELKGAPVALTIAQSEGSKYALAARFGNVGSREFKPSAAARLTVPLGEALCETKLEGPTDFILPLGTPQFGGVMDFTDVPDGAYKLVADMYYGGDQPATATATLRVSTERQRKVVVVIDDEPPPPGTPAGNK